MLLFNKCERKARLRLVSYLVPLMIIPISSVFASCEKESGKQGTKNGQNEALFEYNNKVYTKKDLPVSIQQALYDADSEHLSRIKKIIDNGILDLHVKELAAKSEKDPQAIKNELATVETSEEEAKKWYQANKARLGGRNFESIKKDILQFLSHNEGEKALNKLVYELKSKNKFVSKIDELKPFQVDQISIEGYPSKGPKDAKVTIVEFADYRCPHCREASEVFKKVLDKYKGKSVRYVYLDFPLSQGGLSSSIAYGAVCAANQGKFWEYHYMAFDRQLTLNAESPASFAKELKLNEEKFNNCMASNDTKEVVNKSYKEGMRIGVRATPAVYINGLKVEGHEEASISQQIDKFL